MVPWSEKASAFAVVIRRVLGLHRDGVGMVRERCCCRSSPAFGPSPQRGMLDAVFVVLLMPALTLAQLLAPALRTDSPVCGVPSMVETLRGLGGSDFARSRLLTAYAISVYPVGGWVERSGAPFFNSPFPSRSRVSWVPGGTGGLLLKRCMDAERPS